MDQQLVIRLIKAGKTDRDIHEVTLVPRHVIRKIRESRTRAIRNRTVASLVLAALLLATTFRATSKPSEGALITSSSPATVVSAKATAPAWAIALNKLRGEYHRNIVGNTENKWLVTIPAQNVQEAEAQRAIANGMIAHAETAFRNYSSDAYIKHLGQKFAGKLKPTYYGEPVTKHLPQLWVMAYPAVVSESFNNRTIFFADHLGMFVILGFDYDPLWFHGQILHEALHADYLMAGKPSATANPESEIWISEEIDAHNLQRKVLDLQSKGNYSSEAKQIVASLKAKTLEDIYVRLTPQNILNMNNSISPGNNLTEHTQRMAFHIMTVAYAWSDTQPNPQQFKIQAYRDHTTFRALLNSRTPLS